MQPDSLYDGLRELRRQNRRRSLGALLIIAALSLLAGVLIRQLRVYGLSPPLVAGSSTRSRMVGMDDVELNRLRKLAVQINAPIMESTQIPAETRDEKMRGMGG